MGPIQVPQPRQAEEEEADEQEQEHLKGQKDPRYLREGEEIGSLFDRRASLTGIFVPAVAHFSITNWFRFRFKSCFGQWITW